MKLIDYLQQIKKTESLPIKQVTCFVGADYPYLFFTKLFSFLDKKKWLPAEYRTLNFESTDKKELQSSLSQTFLGEKSFYWLSNATVKSTDKKGTNLLQFILKYNGPHFVAFYLDKTKGAKFLKSSFVKNSKINIVELGDDFDLTFIKKLFDFFEFEISKNKLELFKSLFSGRSNRPGGSNSFSLDQICMLMQYFDLISPRHANDFVAYLAGIVNQTSPSLNLLGNYFFENKPQQFFDVWSKVQKDYPDIFWISFWAEKIYRAYFVVKFLKDKQEGKARSLSFGLPYMFIKRDWKSFSLNKLSNYHNFLYTNDFKIKTGSKFCFLDLFYLNHFNNKI